MRIGITGSSGLIGWHTRCYIESTDALVAIECTRDDFADADRLDKFVKGCDAIIHFAGKNRGLENQIESVNLKLATDLIASMERVASKPHLVFSSSTHIEFDTAYGRSKREVTKMFSDWAARQNARFTNLILPHVFGEHGRPFYNSVVSTFCYQFAHDEKPTVNRDSPLELLHAGKVADIAVTAITEEYVGDLRPTGQVLKVSQLLQIISGMAELYLDGVIPAFKDQFEVSLFNTFRSYLYPDFYPKTVELHTDERGSLLESVKTKNGGQAFLSTTKPGVTRGNHYHFHKIERFLVIKGDAIIRIRRLFSSKVYSIAVNGDTPVYIDIPTLHTHNITNVSNIELLTFFWSHEIFDRKIPDTFAQGVNLERKS